MSNAGDKPVGAAEDVDMFDLRRQVCEHSFRDNPPAQHWLNSDATFSYCWPCARQARWEEMGNVGPAPFEVAFYHRDPIEENIRDGIDGGEWYSANSDTTVQCETCGDTLHYWLTEYGISDEIGYWRDEWSGAVGDVQEQAYALDRLFEAYSDEEKTEVAEIAQRWLSALSTPPTPEQPDMVGELVEAAQNLVNTAYASGAWSLESELAALKAVLTKYRNGDA